MLLVPDSGNPEGYEIINLTEIAKKFAEINNCFTLIIVEANFLDIKKYKPALNKFQASMSEESSANLVKMPGYSAVVQTLPIESNFGETPIGPNRLKECFDNETMTLEDFLVINNINDHMIDIYTTSSQVAKYNRINLF